MKCEEENKFDGINRKQIIFYSLSFKLTLLLFRYSCDRNTKVNTYLVNVDETGLFYKLKPDKSLSFKTEKCVGGKKAKDRLTVLVGASMAGE